MENEKTDETDPPHPGTITADVAADHINRSRQDDGRVTPPEDAAHPSPEKAAYAPLAGDILHGADEIAEFLYGDRKSRRKVYHLVENGHIPFFKIGVNICARRSVLIEWIEAQEHGRMLATPESREQDSAPPR